jgi:putative phosphoribosyl transferase
MEVLRQVRAPTLMIVGGLDQVVVDLNSDAMDFLRTDKALEIVPRAGHLFEEPGALRKVAELAAQWFERHLRPGFGAGLSEGLAPAGA